MVGEDSIIKTPKGYYKISDLIDSNIDQIITYNTSLNKFEVANIISIQQTYVDSGFKLSLSDLNEIDVDTPDAIYLKSLNKLNISWIMSRKVREIPLYYEAISCRKKILFYPYITFVTFFAYKKMFNVLTDKPDNVMIINNVFIKQGETTPKTLFLENLHYECKT